jgi:hypothetical protein
MIIFNDKVRHNHPLTIISHREQLKMQVSFLSSAPVIRRQHSNNFCLVLPGKFHFRSRSNMRHVSYVSRHTLRWDYLFQTIHYTCATVHRYRSSVAVYRSDINCKSFTGTSPSTRLCHHSPLQDTSVSNTLLYVLLLTWSPDYSELCTLGLFFVQCDIIVGVSSVDEKPVASAFFRSVHPPAVPNNAQAVTLLY